ncbi:MAG: protein translocase subunit secA [Fibrobacteres bacterium]|nr:protein translocase subunit secA [Fibrobacterota bacterium]
MIVNAILAKIFGTSHEREVKRLQPKVEEINLFAPAMEALDDADLTAKTVEFRARLAEGKTLDDLLPEAFAVCREAADRRLGMLNVLNPDLGFDISRLSPPSQKLLLEARGKLGIGRPEPAEGEAPAPVAEHHTLAFPASFYNEIRTLNPESRFPFRYRPFDVQLIGGMVLHQGMIAEMKTGEGKTVVATLPVYLNALEGKGVHVVTVNDYLARRDAQTMGKVYRFLGLTVGIIVHGLDEDERKRNYASDIAYGTNNEFGFDYLRDNMAHNIEDCVQRELNFAIVDEVDSILVDEARTPLIISGPAEQSTDKYKKANEVVRYLVKDTHYTLDEKEKHVSLTEEGVNVCEEKLELENLYGDLNVEWVHHVQQALRSHVIFKRDVDYMVKNRQVVIVDEFTGRLMEGRRYSEGLHQAIEAKENVPIQRENQTLATITFQNLFRLYKKLGGMTGTADTEASEFQQIYKLRVVVIPTNRNMVRIDQDDLIYKTRREKIEAIVQDIKERHEKGQPVLVGTVSIEKSEELSGFLLKQGVPHEVLNAKHHQREAGIIEEAGHKGRVTIATNMAGRGTDIQLGEGVTEAGGLYVLGTERHESRRIDNQLRGRSGRQGDPGESRFYLSLEDDLMRIFGSDRISRIMDRLGVEEGEVISHPLVNRAIATAQKRVEGQNFEIRKHLLEYDDVMNKQRTVVYGLRRRILNGEEIKDEIEVRIEEAVDQVVSQFSVGGNYPENWELDKMYAELKRAFDIDYAIAEDVLHYQNADATLDQVIELAKQKYAAIEASIGSEQLREIERQVLLGVIDHLWREHLYAMDHLRDATRFRGYAQKDPLQEYKKEGFAMFATTLERIAMEVSARILHIDPDFLKRQQEAMIKAREIELARMRQMEFSMPGEPEGGVSLPPQGADPQQPREMPAVHVQGGQPVRAPQTATGPSAPRPMQQARSMAMPGPRQAGPAIDVKNIGRNDPCPCGSGKKFKKCHGTDA